MVNPQSPRSLSVGLLDAVGPLGRTPPSFFGLCGHLAQDLGAVNLNSGNVPQGVRPHVLHDRRGASGWLELGGLILVFWHKGG